MNCIPPRCHLLFFQPAGRETQRPVFSENCVCVLVGFEFKERSPFIRRAPSRTIINSSMFPPCESSALLSRVAYSVEFESAEPYHQSQLRRPLRTELWSSLLFLLSFREDRQSESGLGLKFRIGMARGVEIPADLFDFHSNCLRI